MDVLTARALLGVASSADADEIKRAFRRRARSAHPDRGGSSAAFQRLVDAQRVALSGCASPRPSSAAALADHRWMTPRGGVSRRIDLVDSPPVRRRPLTPTSSSGRSFGEILAREIAAA